MKISVAHLNRRRHSRPIIDETPHILFIYFGEKYYYNEAQGVNLDKIELDSTKLDWGDLMWDEIHQILSTSWN